MIITIIIIILGGGRGERDFQGSPEAATPKEGGEPRKLLSRSVGPKCWGDQKMSRFFPCPATIFHTTAREPKRTIQGYTPPKFQKDPQEKERKKIVVGEGKKREILGGPGRSGLGEGGPNVAGRWRAQHFALSFPLPHPFSLFLSLSGCLLVEIWWCLKCRDAQMCTFGVLRLSCGKLWRDREKSISPSPSSQNYNYYYYYNYGKNIIVIIIRIVNIKKNLASKKLA